MTRLLFVLHPVPDILLSRWEHERLTMQKEDLEEKWREIQQTKLSKENQRSLGESSQTSASQEFSALDKARKIYLPSRVIMLIFQANKQREIFHTRRMEELDSIIKSFEEMIEAKQKENKALEVEVADMEKSVEDENRELITKTLEEEEAGAKLRLRRVMKRNKLAEQIKEQQDLLISLQQQVDAFVLRTFPTLG